MRVSKISSCHASVSWTNNCVPFYLHIICSEKYNQFHQHLANFNFKQTSSRLKFPKLDSSNLCACDDAALIVTVDSILETSTHKSCEKVLPAVTLLKALHNLDKLLLFKEVFERVSGVKLDDNGFKWMVNILLC